MVHPKLYFIFKIIIDIETIFFESQKKSICVHTTIFIVHMVKTVRLTVNILLVSFWKTNNE